MGPPSIRAVLVVSVRMLFVLVIINIIVAFFTASYARSKGYSGVLWYFLGLVFGLLALLVLAAAPDRVPVLATNPHRLTPIGQVQAVRTSLPNETLPKARSELDEKWVVLKQVDRDIEEAAKRVVALSPSLEEELARKFLALNDKSYLDQLVERTIVDFEASQKARLEAQADLQRKFDVETIDEMRRYEELLTEARLDPLYEKKVLSVDAYTGSWAGFRGGILISLEDGSKVIRRKGLTRRFLDGDDSWA